MNWVVLAVVAWVFAGLEVGLRAALSVGQSDVAPSFVFILFAFIALTGARPTVLWASVALGLLMDLLFEVALKQGAGTVTAPGPHVLGFALAAQLILAMRGMMIRRNPLTLAFLACLGAMVANTTVVAIFTLRHLFGAPIAWETKAQLFAGFGSALYTGALAFFLAFALFPMAGPLGLPNQQSRRFAVRR